MQPNYVALRGRYLFGEDMSAKVIPFRRSVRRVSKRTSVPEFVQVPFAGLMEMFEQASMANCSEGIDSKKPEAPSSEGTFDHL